MKNYVCLSMNRKLKVSKSMKTEWKEALWKEYLKEADYLKDKAKQLEAMGKLFYDNVSFLYDIYPLIGTGKECREDKESGLIFETEIGDLHVLRKDGGAVGFKTEEIKRLLIDMIGLFEEILPIGSIVDLNKEVLSKNVDVSEIQKFRVAIVKRFLGNGNGCYYPYGAVVYPLGTSGKKRLMTFTPALIENVVFTGYSDDMEEYFIYLMKKELIINQRRKSAGFATKQELEKLRESILKEEENE